MQEEDDDSATTAAEERATPKDTARQRAYNNNNKRSRRVRKHHGPERTRQCGRYLPRRHSIKMLSKVADREGWREGEARRAPDTNEQQRGRSPRRRRRRRRWRKRRPPRDIKGCCAADQGKRRGIPWRGGSQEGSGSAVFGARAQPPLSSLPLPSPRHSERPRKRDFPAGARTLLVPSVDTCGTDGPSFRQ